jgi:predicted amidohydrolase YtcJ
MFTLLTHASVLTMDERRPRAGSLLMAAGRIVALFDEQEPDLTLPRGVAKFDLGGACLMPSFTDSHIHFLDWGFSLDRLDASGAASPIELAERVGTQLARRAAGGADPSAPLFGNGWLESDWHATGGPPRSTAPLDAVAPQTPVVLYSRCTHQAWLNAAALRRCGIRDDTPDPPRGRIVRDAAGHATGVLQEEAIRELVEPALPLRRALEAAHDAGITGVHCLEPVETFATYCAAARDGELPMRIRFYLPGALLLGGSSAGGADDFGLATSDAGGRVSLAGFKFFADGALGGRTAWMDAPYLGDGENRGMATLTPAELSEIVRRAVPLRAELAIHAIGDAAVAMVLDAYEEARRLETERWPGRPLLRHRIEHLQTIRPEDIARAARLGIWAPMQPIHLMDDWAAADRLLGERAERCYRCASALAAGVQVAFGSDAPIAPPAVPLSLHAAVTRTDLRDRPEGGWLAGEAVTIEQALRAHTHAGARLAGDGATRGWLGEGSVADLVVLDCDPTEIDPEDLRHLRVLATLIEGEVVAGNDWIASRRDDARAG